MSGVTPNYGLILPVDGEGYDVDIINQNNLAIDLLLLERFKQSHGVKLHKKIVANGGAVGTTAVVDYFPSFAFKGGRKYKLIWHGEYTQSATGTYHKLRIQTCAVADTAVDITNLTSLGGRQFSAAAASVAESFYVEAFYEPPADTTLQVKFTSGRAVGAGNWNMLGAADAPAHFIIEDVGAQY